MKSVNVSRRQSCRWTAMLVMIGMAVAVGCEKSNEQGSPAQPSSPQPVQAVVPLQSPVELWQAGKHEEAQRLLLATDWANASDGNRESVFGMTESAYLKLTAGERAQYDAESNSYVRALQELVRTSLDAAKAKSATDAERECSAILEFGRYVGKKSGRLAKWKAVGKGIERAALNELIALYSTSGQQSKLEAAKRELLQL